MNDPSMDVNDNQKEQNNNLQQDISEKCEPESNLHFFESSDSYDLIFLFKNKSEKCNTKPIEIRAHKNILSLESPVFKTMFSENWMKTDTKGNISKQEIYLDFASIDSFKQMLNYMYSDKVTLCTENVSEVLLLAKRYLISKLEKICISYIKANLSIENCLQIYEMTIFDYAVENICIDYIKSNAYEILRTDSFSYIQKETLATIMKLDGLYSTEIDLFKAVHKWILRSCEESNLPPNKENKRTIIGDLIYLIRFPLMTFLEFSLCITIDSTLLKKSDVTELIKVFGGNLDDTMKFSTCKRFSMNPIEAIKYCEIQHPTRLNCSYNNLVNRQQVINTNFEVDTDIILLGLSLNNSSSKFIVDIKFNGNYQENEITTLRETVVLSKAEFIKKHQPYTITIIIHGNGCLYDGSKKNKFTTDDNIQFTIKNAGAIYDFSYKKFAR